MKLWRPINRKEKSLPLNQQKIHNDQSLCPQYELHPIKYTIPENKLVL
jgi:hypothetical protein